MVKVAKEKLLSQIEIYQDQERQRSSSSQTQDKKTNHLAISEVARFIIKILWYNHQYEGLATPLKSVRDFEILRFHTGFQDFRQDFKISRRISRFQWRFRDFIKDFGISMKISRFQLRFRDFKQQEMIDNYCEYAIAIIDTIKLAL